MDFMGVQPALGFSIGSQVMNRSYPISQFVSPGAWLVCVSAISYRNGVRLRDGIGKRICRQFIVCGNEATSNNLRWKKNASD